MSARIRALCNPTGRAKRSYITTQFDDSLYLHRPELTAEKFIDNPFGPGRLYKTGDLVRWFPNGTIEFLGRLDHQVKIRGFRIELGEIEALLGQHPAVHEVVVLARTGATGAKRLVAHLTLPPSSAPPDAQALAAQLKAYVQDHLPDYMVPSACMVLERFPVTPSGKVDRKALPAPNMMAVVAASDFEPPQTATEKRVARIWVEVLGLEPAGELEALVGIEQLVSRQANFFELGGHSLLAVSLMAAIETHFDQYLPVASLFQAPTVAGLAELLGNPVAELPRSSVLPLQAHGHQPPFFCVPGAGSHALGFRHLARMLGENCPLYGLQPPGFDADQVPLDQMSDLVTRLLDDLLGTQPEGPYCLGGYSAGGVCAFALALALQQRGSAVPMVAIFDALPPSPVQAVAEGYSIVDDRQAVFDVLHLLQQTVGGADPVRKEEIREEAGEANAGLWAYVAAWFQHHTLLPSQIGVAQIKRMVRMYQASIEAVRGYTPEAQYRGQLVLLRASEPVLDKTDGVVAGWQAVCANPIQVHVVPGNHTTLLMPPYVETSVKYLQQAFLQNRTDG